MIYLFIATIIATFLYSFFTKKTTDEGAAKSLSKTSWQYRLVCWTVEREPDFKGYCPFFWSVWLCVIFLPFTVFQKTLGFIWGQIKSPHESDGGSKKGEYDPNFHFSYYYDVFLSLIDPVVPKDFNFAEENWCKIPNSNRYLSENDWSGILEFMSQNPNWQSDFQNFQQNKLKMERRETEKQARRAFYAEKSAQISKFFAPCVKPVMILSVVAAGYYFLQLLFFIGSGISQAVSISSILYSVGFFVIAGLLYFGFKKAVGFIRAAGRVIKKSDPNYEEESQLGEFFGKLIDIILIPFKAFARAYKKECPMIEWKD